MHFFSNRPNRLAEEFKSNALATMAEHGITQDEIADAIGVNRSTIARWFSYQGDLCFPAPLTPMLESKRLRPLAVSIIRFQAAELGLEIRETTTGDALNGSMDDELFEIARLEGKMVEVKDSNPRKALLYCDELDRVTARLRVEIGEPEMNSYQVEKYMPISSVAARWGVSRSHVWRLVKSGALKSVIFGLRNHSIPAEEVTRYELEAAKKAS